ncbi:MAG: NUDIX hydrolase [Clostridium sp.]
MKRDIVFQDTWVQLEASRCELPDGRIIEPFYIRRDPDFAVVVALTKDERLVLVRQYRHGVEKVLLELPAGARLKGEDPKVAAGQGASGETGYQAGHLEFLMKTAPECGQFHRICVLLSRNGC